jgi:hypothetical protein
VASPSDERGEEEEDGKGVGQEKAEKPHCLYQVGRDLQRAGAEAVHERTLQGDGSQAHSCGDRESQADQGEREADDLMTV